MAAKLPGGYQAGETVFYCQSSSKEFPNGDQLRYGMCGKVVGPSKEEPKDEKVEVQFNGNKLPIYTLLQNLTRAEPPPLPGGYQAGQTVFYCQSSSNEFPNGDQLKYGMRGKVVGPSKEEPKDEKVEVQFNGNKLTNYTLLQNLSRAEPPPLPGGYQAGETVFYCQSSSKEYPNGDQLRYGMSGKVVGPSAEEPKAEKVEVQFNGNKLTIYTLVKNLSRADPPPLLHASVPERVPIVSRMSVQAEASTTILPHTRWEDIVPSRSLIDELKHNPLILQKVPHIRQIAQDIEIKLQELKFVPQAVDCMKSIDDDSVAGILGYSHDLQQPEGMKEGNLYFELNNDLRLRDPDGRATMMKRWGVYMHYFLQGYSKLPHFEGNVMRGLPDRDMVIREYAMGRPIQWGAFTSTTDSLITAKSFADMATGIIIKINGACGKRLGPLSFFTSESEVILSPSSRFLVSSTAYQDSEGWWFLELVQQKGETFVF